MLQSPFLTKCIYLLGNGSMLDDGVAHVLSSRTRLRLSIGKYQDDSAFLKEVELTSPDVILVNEINAHDSQRILGLLSSVPSCKWARIIFIRLCNNQIDVYDRLIEKDTTYRRQNIIATASHDLINVILA